MDLLDEGKCGGKVFSSANFVLILMFLTFFCTYVYKMSEMANCYPIFFKIIFAVMAISFGVAMYLKAPLFVEEQKFNAIDGEDKWDLTVSKSLGWLASLSFVLLTFEPSFLTSFFSGIKISFFARGRVCKFTLEKKAVKCVHRFLDFILLLVSIPIVYFITSEIFYFSWRFGFLIFVLSVLIYLRRELLYTFFSLNVGEVDGVKVNVIYPYSTLRSRYKLYGYANLFKNKAFITEETFKASPTVKDFVIAHELGHLDDKKRAILHKAAFLVLLAFLTMVPFYLGESFAFVPLALFFIYNRTVARLVSEKIELTADKYAVGKIGKKGCLEALHLLCKASVVNAAPNSLFSNYVPLSRRIQFIDAYIEQEN